MNDKKVEKIIKLEEKRQSSFVELIASENFVSNDVLTANGSVFTNKYAEGYPGARYYGGVENVDEIENLARNRIKKLFNAKFANVQPHSGTSANIAAYMTLLKPGDKILGMALDSGGHLTHGHYVNISGFLYQSYSYGVNRKTEMLDYDEIEKKALKIKPKLIICGASAYSRTIDFAKFRKIANKVNAYLMADVAHIAGLIVAKLHPNPLDYMVDIVTSTTHKTLRGARGGIILTNNEELAKKIDKIIFPGIQGGPLVNNIVGKTVAFGEALRPSFKIYMKEVVNSASGMANFFLKHNIKIITGGTDTHLFLIDVKKSFNITGKEAEDLLHYANIVVNKNMIPFDVERPIYTSGIRIGTAAMVTKGFKKADFIRIAEIIIDILEKRNIRIAKKYSKEILELLGI